MDTPVPHELVHFLDESLRNIKMELLGRVCEEYNLPYKKVIKQFVPKKETTYKTLLPKRKAYNSFLPVEDRCAAVTRNGMQCRKTKIPGTTLCQIHLVWKKK
jgi:hypothetical protein